MAKRRRRSNGIIDRLPDVLKDTVDQMLLASMSYREVVEYLSTCDVQLSQMSVHRYAERYLGTVEMLKMSQENMKMVMVEMDKYPDLDFTEAILRITSQNMFNAITSLPDEAWEGIDPAKLLKESNALIRAAGYKKKIDTQLKSDKAAALESNQALLFDILAKKHPELYEQVSRVVSAEKLAQEEKP